VLKRQDLVDARNDQQTTRQNLQSLSSQLQKIGAPGLVSTQNQLQALRTLDPTTAANIQMIDALATSNIGNASLQSQLLTLRGQLINDAIANANTGANSAKAVFDQLDQIVTRLGTAPTQEYFYNGGANLTLTRLFRNGITFAPFFNGTNNGTNYLDKPFSADFGGKGIYPLYTFKGGFNVTLPLARGLGAEAVAAPERSSLINEEAANLDYQHEASASARDTINAYWALRSAQDNVDIAQRSVDLQNRIVELTRGTIAAGDLPQIELARVQASQARSQAALRDAQVNLNQARVALATAMGIATTGDDLTLPRARDPFPPAPDATSVSEQQMAALAAAAIPQRRDVTAAARRTEAADVLVRGARLNLKPLINVSGGSWYTGLAEATPGTALNHWVGPSYQLALDVEKPFGNNQLRGALVQAQAGSATSQINFIDLQRQVRLNVVRTTRSLTEAIERVRQAQAAVNFYQQTIDSEIERFRLGEVTLIDTITTESQQADARRALVAAQQDVAQLIAELRFQTGTLVPNASATVTPQNLVTVPQK
jgi:outer membrane protein TolC